MGDIQCDAGAEGAALGGSAATADWWQWKNDTGARPVSRSVTDSSRTQKLPLYGVGTNCISLLSAAV